MSPAGPVHLLRVPYQGQVLVVAVSRSTPGVGYVLTPGPDGRLTCSCPGFAFRGDCSHVRQAMVRRSGSPAGTA